MRPTLLAAALALVFALAPVPAQLTLLDDFAAGNDQRWTRVDTLAALSLGTTSYTVTGGRYRIASTAPLPALPQIASTGSMFADSVARPAHYHSGRLRALVRLDNANTSAVLVMRYDAASYSGYNFAIDNVLNALYITRQQGATVTNLVFTGLPVANATDYLVEAECLGSTLTLRAWPSSGVMPAQPQLSVVDAQPFQGGIGLAIYNQSTGGGGGGGTLSAQFDDVWFTPYANLTMHGQGCMGSWNATPQLTVTGQPSAGHTMQWQVQGGGPGAFSGLILGFGQASIPISPQCHLLIANPMPGMVGFVLDGAGRASLPTTLPGWLTSGTFQAQVFVVDAPAAFAASQGIQLDWVP